MRIGIFGNTNNYPLLLALALRQMGHDALLVVNRREPLHRPETRCPEFREGYPEWMLDCSALPDDDFVVAHPSIESVLNFLASGSDALVLNDLGPSLLDFCDVPAMALITGSDATCFADLRSAAIREAGWSSGYRSSPAGRLSSRSWRAFVERQRRGIAAAAAVSAPFPGLVPAVDELLREIGVDEARRDFLYIADVPESPERRTATSGPLRVVNGARLNWTRPLPPGFSSQDHKGTDVLLHGFARFIGGGGSARLTLFRKGLHVAETEALVGTLGLAAHVTWHDEVPLHEFTQIIGDADVVCDQLGESFPGMVALDAMARGVPVVANFRPEILARHYADPLPPCHAATESDVSGWLSVLADPRVREDVGGAARLFARKHFSARANAERCLRVLRRPHEPPGVRCEELQSAGRLAGSVGVITRNEDQ